MNLRNITYTEAKEFLELISRQEKLFKDSENLKNEISKRFEVSFGGSCFEGTVHYMEIMARSIVSAVEENKCLE